MRRVRTIGKREECGNGMEGEMEEEGGTAMASEAVSVVGKEQQKDDSRLEDEQEEEEGG